MADSYTFLPWVRQGAVSAITTDDLLDDTLDSRVQVDVTVRLNNDANTDATVKVRLYGPGDVTGLDARQVIRTDPQHLTPDFEPNYFATVEFDRPDFPWLFTPGRARQTAPGTDNGRLRPWICLVVVEKREGVSLILNRQPLPVLKIEKDAQSELPDLAESWAWAHAQVSGELTTDQPLRAVLADRPERTLSRLLCPRKLKSNRSYYACVVPAFEVGRKAGLGEPVDDLDRVDSHGVAIKVPLKPAWENTTPATELPVYYWWEFSTGAAGDFESLVWLLQRRSLSSGDVGTRNIIVVNPDPKGDPQASPPRPPWPEIGEVPLEGALRPYRETQIPEDPLKVVQARQNYKDFQERLRGLVNKPEEPQSTASLPPGLPIAPPIYGRWHAAQGVIPNGARDVAWLRELNLNPSHRVVAGLGTQIIQEQQEQLMASAWEQVGEIEKANQALRQAQLARSAGTTIHEQHLKKMPAETFFHVTGAMHARIMMDTEITDPPTPQNKKTLYATVRASVVPQAVVQGPFRRLTRPRGPLARRLAANGGLRTGQLIKKLNDNELKVAPERRAPKGMVTLDEVFRATGRSDRFCAVTESKVHERLRPLIRCFRYRQLIAKLCFLRPRRTLSDLTSELRLLFGFSARSHQRDMVGCEPRTPEPKPRLLLEPIKTALLERVRPEITISKRLKGRLVTPPSWKPDDPLEPIMAAPEFPTPMYKPLADLSQDFMLPGLEHVPPNTITMLATNPRFIEAYLVGLNHEMSRELLWREFPTDQHGTYFRQFWDPRGRVPQPQDPEALKDIKPIPEWETGKALGGNLTGDSGKSKTVLLIRGDLLRRYPRAIIYAAEAKWVQAKDKDDRPIFDRERRPVMVREPIELPPDPDPTKSDFPEKYPIFQGTLSPDITFLGFDLDPTTAIGDQTTPTAQKPGWFFVLQQPPTEPRFGLDETEPAPLTGTWRDLSRQNLKLTGGGHIALTNAFIGKFTAPSSPANVTWGSVSNSAALAYITLQGPFRVAIHASDLLPLSEKP